MLGRIALITALLLPMGAFAQQAVSLVYGTGGYSNLPVTLANPLPVQSISGTSAASPTTNVSAAIVTGNTFQTIAAASLTRKTLQVVNNNTNGDNCWLYLGAGSATKAASILLTPGGSANYPGPTPPSDAVQMTCTTTADTVYVATQ